MISDFNILQKFLFSIYAVAMAAFSIGLPVLYFVGIYKRKYTVKAELLSWKYDKYSTNITCDIGLTSLSNSPFLINGICIKPAYNSSAFNKKRYEAAIESGKDTDGFPIYFSTLQRRKISVSFPIDLSSYYDINENNSKAKKPWLLILKTNRLEREFRIDSPFSKEHTDMS